MDDSLVEFWSGPPAADIGCAYLLGEGALGHSCGKPRHPGSVYCPEHHALCHIRCGTAKERKLLREVEALASAVGGRRASAAGGPPRHFLRRLEHAIRTFSRP